MASQHALETSTLRTQFKTSWDADSVLSAYPVAWDNAPFTVPDPADVDAWARFAVVPGDTERLDLGATSHALESVGVVIVSVFTPSNEGRAANDAICDDVDEIFFAFRSTSGTFYIRTRPASRRVVGRDGSWYQQNVVIPYVRESVRTA